MGNYSRFTIKAKPEIISEIKKAVDGSAAEILEETGDVLCFDTNVRFNELIADDLKKISRNHAEDTITFSYSDEVTNNLEVDTHEIKNGMELFIKKEIDYSETFDCTKLPEAVKVVIEKLKGLDTVTGEKITWFPKVETTFVQGGEEFCICKNHASIGLTIRNAESKEMITKYDREFTSKEDDLSF